MIMWSHIRKHTLSECTRASPITYSKGPSVLLEAFRTNPAMQGGALVSMDLKEPIGHATLTIDSSKTARMNRLILMSVRGRVSIKVTINISYALQDRLDEVEGR
jgi:hypothetical protein